MYYHPLFHRDRPQDLHKLRRRTCPGLDGRRNRPNASNTSSPPFPSPSVASGERDAMEDSIYSNEEEMVMMEEEDDVTEVEMMSPPGGIKVSRSPSPTSSSAMVHDFGSISVMDHLHFGRGSVCPSARFGGSLKSVVSEEEKSPIVIKTSRYSSSMSSWNNRSSTKSKKDFFRTVSQSDSNGNPFINEAEMMDCNRPTMDPAKPVVKKSMNVADDAMDNNDLDTSLLSANFNDTDLTTSSKPKKSKQSNFISLTPENDDADSTSSSSTNTRKKYSEKEFRDRKDHLNVVAEVSRRLNEICSDYIASSNSTRKHRGRGRSRGRPAANGSGGNCGGSGANGGTTLAFGLEKSSKYYSLTKCDLFTYDDEEDGLEEHENTAETNKKERHTNAICLTSSPLKQPLQMEISPPTQDQFMIDSITRACLVDNLSNNANKLERIVSTAILAFCLSTHPQDPDLSPKIVSHLKKCPLLAEEFENYCKALSRGVPGSPHSSLMRMWVAVTMETHPLGQSQGNVSHAKTIGTVCALEDLKRDWKTFSLNYIKGTDLSLPITISSRIKTHAVDSGLREAVTTTAAAIRNSGIQLTLPEQEAIKRCVAVWFQESCL